jgi:hypothetical protein
MEKQRQNAANKTEDAARQAETKIETSRKTAGMHTTPGGHKCQTREAGATVATEATVKQKVLPPVLSTPIQEGNRPVRGRRQGQRTAAEADGTLRPQVGRTANPEHLWLCG